VKRHRRGDADQFLLGAAGLNAMMVPDGDVAMIATPAWVMIDWLISVGSAVASAGGTVVIAWRPRQGDWGRAPGAEAPAASAVAVARSCQWR
jgi:hypothetical protein